MEKLVDAAEPWDIREKLLETGWEQKRMLSGDYMFHAHNHRRVGVTRKTVSDLLASISSRYADVDPATGKRKRKKTFGVQLEEMLDWYDIYILLFEGSWRRVNTSDSILTGFSVIFELVGNLFCRCRYLFEGRPWLDTRGAHLFDFAQTDGMFFRSGYLWLGRALFVLWRVIFHIFFHLRAPL